MMTFVCIFLIFEIFIFFVGGDFWIFLEVYKGTTSMQELKECPRGGSYLLVKCNSSFELRCFFAHSQPANSMTKLN